MFRCLLISRLGLERSGNHFCFIKFRSSLQRSTDILFYHEMFIGPPLFMIRKVWLICRWFNSQIWFKLSNIEDKKFWRMVVLWHRLPWGSSPQRSCLTAAPLHGGFVTPPPSKWSHHTAFSSRVCRRICLCSAHLERDCGLIWSWDGLFLHLNYGLSQVTLLLAAN